jgi:hypothetical protein
MKKLTAKLKPTKDSHSADPKHTYRRVESEECDTIFNIPVSEITRGAYGCLMAKCPRCFTQCKNTPCPITLTRSQKGSFFIAEIY